MSTGVKKKKAFRRYALHGASYVAKKYDLSLSTVNIYHNKFISDRLI